MANPKKRQKKKKGPKSPESETKKQTESKIILSPSKMEVKDKTLERKTAEAIESAARMDAEIKAEEEKGGKLLKKKISTEAFQEKAKSFLLSCSGFFNRARDCQTFKVIGKKGNLIVQKGLTGGKKGMAGGARFIGSVPDRISKIAKLSIRLPIIRRKIQGAFRLVGARVYQLKLKGAKDVMQDREVKKLIKQVKEYEQEIEVIESELMVVDRKIEEEGG